MAVKVVVNETGESFIGKFAVIQGDQVGCFTGIMADKKGGFRGCGKKRVFSAETITISADDPAKEIKRI
ncbi:MAG: hypothetical protein HYY02_08355 [Chloroflexi bacterium]|nr:hypothetical protein [Chloroflexota bacterium]